MSRVLSRLPKLAGMIFASCAQATALVARADTPSHPFAAPQSIGQPATSGTGGLAQVTLALLLVLVAVFAVAWIVKRMRGFGNRVGDAIDIIADIPLGQKERAVLLKVGPTQILVGVAPGRVNTLHVLAEPLDLTRAAARSNDNTPTFKSLLLMSLGK